MPSPQIDVTLLGRLARLDFTAEMKQQFAAQLPGILDYVGQLQAVQVESLAPSIAPVVSLRTDQVEISRAVDQILSEAPERQDRFWKVRSVF
jgi:aspartyl-tRNA(Asn)/glutamyl-tRNA(Gln) amidotransferase subunit C